MGAVMTMPKTAVNEYGRVKAWQDDVGRPGEAAHVNPKPQARTMKVAANRQLGSGILAPDPFHERRALRSRLHGSKEAQWRR